ncbi:MAG: hypothetical protein AB1327_08150 [Bacillota bacterium]
MALWDSKYAKSYAKQLEQKKKKTTPAKPAGMGNVKAAEKTRVIFTPGGTPKATLPAKPTVSAANAGANQGTSYRGSTGTRSGSRDVGASPTGQYLQRATIPKAQQPLTPGMRYATRTVQQGGNPYLAGAGGMAIDVAQDIGRKVAFALPSTRAKTIGTVLRAAASKVAPAVPALIAVAGQRAGQIGSRVAAPIYSAVERAVTSPIAQRAANVPVTRTVSTQLNRPGVGPAMGGALTLGTTAVVGGMMPTTTGASGGRPPTGYESMSPPVDQQTAGATTPGGGNYYTPAGNRANTMTTGGAGVPGTGTPAGTQGQGLDTSTLPPLPGEQGQLPQPEQPPMPEMPDWNAMLREQADLIQQAAQQNTALAASFLNQSLQQLDQLQAQIMAQYQQMGQGIDPATQAALQNLREEINQRRQNLMEEMNRRGLLQSGVWLEMENRILKGQMTQEEQLIASRLADVQNRMTDALMQFASQRMNLMGQAAQNQMAIGQWASQAQIGAMQMLQGRQDEWSRWWQGVQEQRRQQAQEQARWQYEQQFNRAKQIANWTQKIPEGYPGAGQPTWQARMAQQKLAQPGSSGTSRAATSEAISKIPQYGSKQEALADFRANIGWLQAQGVDTQAVLNAINAYFGG